VWSEAVETEPIRIAQAAIHAEPGADLSIAALAACAGMSERNFVRVFTREVGEPPGRYVEKARVAAASEALTSRTSGVATIAKEMGFGTSETMRRAFLRQIGVPPNHYRKRFSHAH
jgi:transcriptional regulator GlxA family with amidase domain